MSSSISIVVKFKQPSLNKFSNSSTINYSYNIPRAFSQPKNNTNVNSNTLYQQQLKQLRTIFTSSSKNSDTLCISSTPININTLNQTFQTKEDLFNFSNSILKECTLYEYDKVYNERSTLMNIYNDYIKVTIDNLFLGRNACIISFGPSDSGKENLFLNLNNMSHTLLYKCVNDILNEISIDNICNFEISLTAWMIYGNNNVNELFNKKQITIKKVNELENYCLEIVNKKRNICGLSNINEYDKKSHLIISIKLYKDSNYISQIDFVELACSEFAYGKKNSNKDIEKSINALFDSISEINMPNNMKRNNKTALNYYLKSTCCSNNSCDVVIINCIIPWENPLNFSLKSLKITNTLRNAINNKTYPSYKNTLTENSGRNYNTHYIQPKALTLTDNYSTLNSSPLKTYEKYTITQSPKATMSIPKQKNIAEIQKYRSFNLNKPVSNNNHYNNMNKSFFNKSHYNFNNLNSSIMQLKSKTEELKNSQNKQNECSIQNDRKIASLKNEIVSYKQDISKLKEQLAEQTKINIQLQEELNGMNNSQFKEENESNKTNSNFNKQQFQIEIDYMILKAKHDELKEDYDNMINDFQSTKEMYQTKTKDIENKIDMLRYEVDKLQKENNYLHENQETLINEINEKDKLLNQFKDLYNYEKEQKFILEKDLMELKHNKETEKLKSLKHEELEKMHIQTKTKFANELKGKISKYKELRLKDYNFNTDGNIN